MPSKTVSARIPSLDNGVVDPPDKIMRQNRHLMQTRNPLAATLPLVENFYVGVAEKFPQKETKIGLIAL
jgi:hypothetical protein